MQVTQEFKSYLKPTLWNKNQMAFLVAKLSINISSTTLKDMKQGVYMHVHLLPTKELAKGAWTCSLCDLGHQI